MASQKMASQKMASQKMASQKWLTSPQKQSARLPERRRADHPIKRIKPNSNLANPEQRHQRN
jgi:hypothetical protein